MKLKVVLFALAFSAFSTANARPIEAVISCDCASWKMGQDDEMKLVRGHTGVRTSVEVSEAFSNELIRGRWAQDESTKQGYATVTPVFFQSLPEKQTYLKNGLQAINFVTEHCQTLAKVPGNVACGVSITFPINENAVNELRK